MSLVDSAIALLGAQGALADWMRRIDNAANVAASFIAQNKLVGEVAGYLTPSQVDGSVPETPILTASKAFTIDGAQLSLSVALPADNVNYLTIEVSTYDANFANKTTICRVSNQLAPINAGTAVIPFIVPANQRSVVVGGIVTYQIIATAAGQPILRQARVVVS